MLGPQSWWVPRQHLREDATEIHRLPASPPPKQLRRLLAQANGAVRGGLLLVAPALKPPSPPLLKPARPLLSPLQRLRPALPLLQPRPLQQPAQLLPLHQRSESA